MRRSGSVAVLVVVLSLLLSGAAFSQIQEDIQKHATCKYCGMDRQQYSHSRMLVEYDDGTVMAACSIHCAAVDLATNIDKTPKTLRVGDFNNKELIDAETATWVIGGTKPGVMTKRAKWAFQKKEEGEAFAKVNNGTVATFDEAMKASYEDMYSDTKMIRDKRKTVNMKTQSPVEQKQQ
jgi:nitrous oxide reductase accessory protein NosL